MQTLAELGIELPKMNMNPYIFVDHKQMMMDQLLSEVSELKEELKNAREENMRNFNGYYYPEMWREHPELAQKFFAELQKNDSKKRTNKTGSNEKTTQRELNKKKCYELYDEMMAKAKKLSPSEIKKVIAERLHLTTKTINEYLRERP